MKLVGSRIDIEKALKSSMKLREKRKAAIAANSRFMISEIERLVTRKKLKPHVAPLVMKLLENNEH